MENENTCKKSSCNALLKFLAFCALVAALVVLIQKIVEKINEKFTVKNYNNELRRFFACFKALNEDLGHNEVQCIKLTSLFSAVTLDLSKADLSADLTLDISGFCSAVHVIMPTKCNVVNVSDYKSSAISFEETKLFDAPTITLVGRITACAIDFERDE